MAGKDKSVVEVSSNTSPSSENDWIVHSINIHGLFFEKGCQKIVSDNPAWVVKASQYPVEFPPPNGPWRGRESVLDILAESKMSNALLAMPVECKKANPDFVNWVFFEKNPSSKETYMHINQVNNLDKEPRELGWTTTQHIQRVVSKVEIPLAEEGRETRANYMEFAKYRQNLDKVTKTANNSITEASNQVALATQAIFNEEGAYCKSLADLNTQENKPYEFSLFLPTIVTSARLNLCRYKPEDVNQKTGEIAFSKAEIIEAPYLIYEYPLPRQLQNPPVDKQSVLHTNPELFFRMHIAIVQSEAFDDYLTKISTAFFA